MGVVEHVFPSSCGNANVSEFFGAGIERALGMVR
jgi:hypothetical protein